MSLEEEKRMELPVLQQLGGVLPGNLVKPTVLRQNNPSTAKGDHRGLVPGAPEVQLRNPFDDEGLAAAEPDWATQRFKLAPR